MAKETRTEYLARISAEFPGAYGRIADLMRNWDHVNGATASEADQVEAQNWAINEGADVSAPEPAEPAVEPEEPASAEQSAQEEQP